MEKHQLKGKNVMPFKDYWKVVKELCGFISKDYKYDKPKNESKTETTITVTGGGDI